MLDIINRGSLLITAITGYTPDHYSWKSHAVQIDSLVMDRMPVDGCGNLP